MWPGRTGVGSGGVQDGRGQSENGRHAPPPFAGVHMGGDQIPPPCAGVHTTGTSSLRAVLKHTRAGELACLAVHRGGEPVPPPYASEHRRGHPAPPPCAKVHGGGESVALPSAGVHRGGSLSLCAVMLCTEEGI